MLEPPASILDALRQREHFLLVSHARPDGDALGSLLGLRLALQAMGKQACVCLRDALPHPYGFLPGAESVTTAAHAPVAGYDSAIVVECSSFSRPHIDGLDSLFTINIDHHFSGHSFATLNWIDPSACAAAEMVFRLVRALPLRVTPAMATCFYTGILADTGGFIFANTSARTLALAAELAQLGAAPHAIASTIYMSYREAKMRLLGTALQHLRIETPLAWMWVTEAEMRGLSARWEDAEGLVNYALAMDGVEVAAFFRPAGAGRQRASLRSKGLIDVGAIAEEFGGGGHRQASGFSQGGSSEEVMERVLGRLRQAIGGARDAARGA